MLELGSTARIDEGENQVAGYQGEAVRKDRFPFIYRHYNIYL